MWEIMLQGLKAAAVFVGTISGVIGTLTKTRDAKTGAPTPAAKRLVGLIIVAGILATATQAVETYLKHAAAEAERAYRDSLNAQSENILSNARAAASGISTAHELQRETLSGTQQALKDLQNVQSRADQLQKQFQGQEQSLATAIGGVNVVSNNLNGMLRRQSVELEHLYRLTNPLGTIRAELRLIYPLGADSRLSRDAAWVERARTLATNGRAVLPSDFAFDEWAAQTLLRHPELMIIIRGAISSDGHGERPELILRPSKTDPWSLLISDPRSASSSAWKRY